MVILVWASSIASPIVETVLSDRQHYVEGKTSTVALAVTLNGLGAVIVPVIAVAATFFIALYWRVTAPSLLLVIAPGLVLAANELAHGRPPTLGLLITATAGALLVSVRVKLPDLAVVGYLGALVATASVAAFFLAPSKVLISGGVNTFDKSLTGAPLLAGIFTHSNTFGMFLALALPFVFLARRWPVRLLLLAALGWALILSSSRTALVGAAVVLVVLMLARILPRTAFAAVAILGFAVSAFAMLWLPFTETDPEAYTHRGSIWIFDRQQLGDHWLSGLGAHWFADNYPLLRSVLSSAASHAHNLALTTLIQGGVVVLAAWTTVMVVALFATLRRPSARQRGVGVAFLLGLLAVGATETPFGLVGWGPLSASALIPLFVLAGQGWIEREEDEHARALSSVPLTRASLRARRR
ncbi:O-antigen ligase family protein [Microbacterium enclense]|uniref:O-antigen ligase family protein n=1 Tax=Microbacterium enclense TaxID=993073 RepID=UPI00203F4C5D|nr:O-antigen ligase family protein [Microbacterium enclense]MCM3615066.1 O-antigen ligase family protein [Microbacterium enclense]